ncbi:MAG TPA: succinate dehydrogenase assembly factor 2 [Steroidobacteraceae bacterium]|jgi:antitoxin CptB|nr:succinate dehydrogenase assembly factor 2 [Steroidobacteraceae bacterium]
MPADSAAAARARLIWHCRRGSRELDLLLRRWLEQCYDGSDAVRRALFEALLEMPDPALTDYLLAGARPEQPELAELVQAIRGLASHRRGPTSGYNKSDN